MKKSLLYVLLLLYAVFLSMEFLRASRLVLLPPTNALRLMFSLGCVIWIHLDRRDIFETVDFDYIRIFLIFMFITDFILATLGTLAGSIGRLFFITGTVSASFGHFALILRHLRLSVFDRTHAIGAISLDLPRKAQIRYFIVFALAEGVILSICLAAGATDSFPYMVFYIFISLVSAAAASLYLLSKNPASSRFPAFGGLALLILSDSFIGFGLSALKDWPYLTLVIWALYAPVLLLIGASILRRRPANLAA